MYSDHVNKDRAERIALVDRIGWGDRLTSIVVNRGRKEGREVLILTNNAIIKGKKVVRAACGHRPAAKSI